MSRSRTILPGEGIFNLRYPSLFVYRSIFGYVAYLLLKLILKNRYDSLIKLDFISKERLKTEINISNEKLALLMPKFILDRINYFEISSN